MFKNQQCELLWKDWFRRKRNELDENWLVSSKNLPISNCWIPTKKILDFSNICHFVHIVEHQFSLIFRDYAKTTNGIEKSSPSIEFPSFWTDLFKSQLGVSTEKRRRSLSNRSMFQTQKWTRPENPTEIPASER